MPAQLCRDLAAWTAGTAVIAVAMVWLVPVAITPAARLDGRLAQLCAVVAAFALVGLWTAAGVRLVLAARSTGGDRAPGPPISEVLP